VGGTSYSSPIVAGVAALVLSANPSLSAAQVQDIVKQSADDLGPAGWDPSYGWGRVNAARAVSLASGGGSVDTTSPTASFLSPASGSSVSGTVAVQIAASDNVGVSLVSLKIDGVAVGGSNTSSYMFSWNTLSASNGAHVLTASAQDAAGNTSSTSVSVSVYNLSDTSPPTVYVTSPAAGTTAAGNVTVLVDAVDNVAVTKVELYVDGSLVASSTSSPFSTKWNTRKVKAGAHTLVCKAYDSVRNVGVSPPLTVYK
jgi:thermitase